MNAFERYAPFIQDYIYASGWKVLRGVQNAAAQAIFETDDNVLLTASTASGKTEAAFFPILTLLAEDPPKSVGVLYIAPLKALINDQFERLGFLCEAGDIAVTRWHGESSQAAKRRLMKHPSGILQITPESLESLLINKHADLAALFGDLRFVVIDEIHSLLRGDRGLQTFCLIERLCRAAGCNPRRVGLSATIGKPEAAGRFFAAGSGRPTVIPRFEAAKEVWRVSLEHFFTTAPQADEGEEGNRTRTGRAFRRACRATSRPSEPIRGLRTSLSTPAAASASSLPTRARSARRSARACGSTARRAASPSGF